MQLHEHTSFLLETLGQTPPDGDITQLLCVYGLISLRSDDSRLFGLLLPPSTPLTATQDESPPRNNHRPIRRLQTNALPTETPRTNM